LTMADVGGGVEKTNYPLVLVSVPGERLHVRLEYDGRLFEPETIARMVGHLDVLLAAVATTPEAPVRDLPLLTAAERELLDAWNRTDRVFPGAGLVPRLFADQVHLTPDAVAVECGDERLTYAELNRRANRLAHHLRSQGVGPERRVAVRL